jgi:hypothetical protein
VCAEFWGPVVHSLCRWVRVGTLGCAYGVSKRLCACSPAFGRRGWCAPPCDLTWKGGDELGPLMSIRKAAIN